MAVGQALGAAGTAVLGAGLDYASASAAARQQYKYQKKMYKHRYQWQVQDMKKAGINPMLSATSGAPVPGSVQAPAFENLGSKAVSAYQAARMNRAAVENTEANTDLSRTTANKAAAEGEAQELANLVTKASKEYQSAKDTLGEKGEVRGASAVSEARFQNEMNKAGAELRNLVQDADLKAVAQKYSQGEITLQEARLKFSDELADLEMAYRRAQAEAERLKLDPLKAEAEFWASAGAAGKVLQFLRALMGSR